jgi:hypothetical protein
MMYYNKETTEPRFKGELKEILREVCRTTKLPVDILFEIDVTGSMDGEIDEVKASATDIMDDIRAAVPDSRFGLVSFCDYPARYEYCGYVAAYGDEGDYPYKLDSALTADTVAVETAINGLSLGYGADGPEDYTRVLYEAGADPVIGWRDGAIKIIVMFGDAPTHDCDFYTPSSTGVDPGRDGKEGTADDLDFETVVADLAAKGVIVLAIDSSASPSPNDPSLAAEMTALEDGISAEESFRYMADETGGAYRKLTDVEDLPAVVVDLVTSVLPCEEYWQIEWFHTIPDQYTEFFLPKEHGKYLFTSAFYAPESTWTLHDGTKIDGGKGSRLKFWYDECSGPLFIEQDGLRIYGNNFEGAGDLEVLDPIYKIPPENPPYTDPIAPFYPQHDQAPEKDFITFNPIKMAHRDYDWDNDGVLDYVYKNSIKAGLKDADEKVFFRMWYEPLEWFKDENADGTPNPTDILAPAIKQEFTYMFLDTYNNPITAPVGTSKFLVPMASRTADNGIDSFDADGDGKPDAVVVCSESNMGDPNTDGRIDGYDIDGDGRKETLSPDGEVLTGDETLLLRLDPKTISEGGRIQFFDFEIEVADTTETGRVTLNIYYKGNPDSMGDEPIFAGTVNLRADMIPNPGVSFATFERGGVNTALRPRGPGFVWVIDVDWEDDTATLVVGRVFGNTHANIGANPQPVGYQKHFYVDGVLYNVVAIMTAGEDEFKYVTFRVKLPKQDVWIEQHSTQLLGWYMDDTLPVMPQYNMNHAIVKDVQSTWTHQKHGPVADAPELIITYNAETTEQRFKGELKEILLEPGWYPWKETSSDDEWWFIEHFQTIPYQYTKFQLPEGHGLYLVTSAFDAPEATWTIWDGTGETSPIDGGTYNRLKFWYDPADNTDIYVNRYGEGPTAPTTVQEYYDTRAGVGNNDGKADLVEVIAAMVDYLGNVYPAFGFDGRYTLDNLMDYILMFLETYG